VCTTPRHATRRHRAQNLGGSVVEVMDTELDPVRIVAAAPDVHILSKGGLGGRKLIVASEYENLTKKWLETQGVPYTFLRAYGATESLPPEDADIIVDNAATGSTLKANNLEVRVVGAQQPRV
jgi:ATP phosphoribosyltransferase